MIIKDIKYIFKHKGPKKAEDEAHEWFTSAKRNVYDPTVVFCENKMLQVGKINQFSYNPKGKDTLDYYDKKPLVISLGTIKRKRRIYELGINLNFIPAPYKWYVLDTIQTINKGFFQRQLNSKASNNAYKQQQIQYPYKVIKALLSKFGFEYAIRMYIPSRKSKVHCINYNSWAKAAFLSLESITHDQMVQEFRKAKNSR